MLREVASLIARADTIVTFNGKSFDLPLLESRMIMNRIRVHVTDIPHLDLLHAARRVYKLRLGRWKKPYLAKHAATTCPAHKFQNDTSLI